MSTPESFKSALSSPRRPCRANRHGLDLPLWRSVRALVTVLPGREAVACSRKEDPEGGTSDRAAGALPCGVGWETVARGSARDPAQPVIRLKAARSRVRRQLVLFETSVISLPGDASIGAVDRAGTQQVDEREHRTPCHVVPRRRASRLTASAAPCRLVLVSTLAGGETVSQGPLESLFQVRILARQPEACESVSQHA